MDEKKVFLYYAFDWDDNILNMPTTIFIDEFDGDKWIPKEIGTDTFAKIRNNDNIRPRNSSIQEMFLNFQDNGHNGDEIFLNDTISAILDGNYGPSWTDLIECLINGSLFSIITARGHEPQSIRKSIEYIIDNSLSDDEKITMYNNLVKFEYLFGKENNYILLHDLSNFSSNQIVSNYLNKCRYIGVSCPSSKYSKYPSEEGKERALLDFKNIINQSSLRIGADAVLGFSDDDLIYIKTIENMIQTIKSDDYISIVKIVVKNTSNPNNITSNIKYFK